MTDVATRLARQRPRRFFPLATAAKWRVEESSNVALDEIGKGQAVQRRDAILQSLVGRSAPPSHEEVVAANRAMMVKV